MSFNIVDLVKDQISDQLLGQMGSILGTQGSQTTGALAGALPALLSGLSSSASTPAGAGALFDAVQKQDDGLLGNIGNLLGGNQANNFASQGTSMLSSLLGGGALGQLAGVVGKFAGIGKNSSSSLLGMLAPIVIGAIKKKVFDGGMNASSLANMLTDQKSNIQAAMPNGFSDQLQSAGFFDSIASTAQDVVSGAQNVAHDAASGVRDAAHGAVSDVQDAAHGVASGVRDATHGAVSGVQNAAHDAASGVRDAAHGTVSSVQNAAHDAASGVRDAASDARSTVQSNIPTPSAPSTGGGFKKWLLPLIAAIAVIAIAMQFLNKGSAEKAEAQAQAVASKASETTQAVANKASETTQTVVEKTSEVAQSASNSAATLVEGAKNALPDGVNLNEISGNLESLFGNATDALSGITDAASATKATAVLTETTSKLGDISGLMDSLPDAAKGPISQVVNTGLGSLQPLIDKVTAIPGVGSILEPVVGPLLEKLTAMAG